MEGRKVVYDSWNVNVFSTKCVPWEQKSINLWSICSRTSCFESYERFPNNICDVVKQGLTYKWNPKIPIKNQCQFSWYCDGKSDVPKEKDAWDTAMMVANHVFYRRVDDLVDGATHYHAHYVQPSWAETKTYIVRIDDHIFYRWDINYE